MFGEGSYISIDVLKYVGNKKNYLVWISKYLNLTKKLLDPLKLIPPHKYSLIFRLDE